MKKKQGVILKKTVSKDAVLEAVILLGENLSGQIQEIRDELRSNVATKTDLVELEERLTGEMRAISRAVDTDSEGIINHERRISKLEKHLMFK
jgi:hypothetical protein